MILAAVLHTSFIQYSQRIVAGGEVANFSQAIEAVASISDDAPPHVGANGATSVDSVIHPVQTST